MNNKAKLLCIAIAAILACNACRKESEIEAKLEPGSIGAVSAFRLLSISHILEQFALHRTDDFFPNQSDITKTDSVYSDGDGIAFTVDFKKGLVCSDGITRRGRCEVEFNDSFLPFTGKAKLKILTADSFGVFSKQGWEFISGDFLWSKLTSDSALIQFSMLWSGKGFERSLTSENMLSATYHQPLGSGKNGVIWNGTWKLKTNGNSMDIQAIKMQNNGACRSNWNLGILEIMDGEKLWSADVNPFGNDACDQVFKVSSGKGFRLDESTFDAW